MSDLFREEQEKGRLMKISQKALRRTMASVWEVPAYKSLAKAPLLLLAKIEQEELRAARAERETELAQEAIQKIYDYSLQLAKALVELDNAGAFLGCPHFIKQEISPLDLVSQWRYQMVG